jgi:acyl-CoA thioester hydrolase
VSAPDLAGRLTDEGHVLSVRVYYEDTDATGVVYHASYVRFFERGRTDYVRLLGIAQSELAEAEEGAAFLVRRMSLDFRRPAKLDDVIEVATKPGAMGGASIALAQTIRRGGDVLVTADVKVALVGRDGRPARIKGALRERLLGGR